MSWIRAFILTLAAGLGAWAIVGSAEPACGQAPTGKKAASRAEPSGAGGGVGVGEYRSQHFLLYTDQTPEEAKELLTRLETMLGLISEYWGQPSRGIIEMYVVKDLEKYPLERLPPEGRRKVEERAGVTITQTLQLRGQPQDGGKAKVLDARAIVYAYADRGVPQHEAVHAYCGQTFGRTGPTWYSEGMAEMGNYWRKGDRTVNVHPVVVKYIRESEPKTLNAIVNNREATGDSWENYAWRWALCHLLANNPNYSARFRPFGLELLNDKDTTFEQVYGDMANEMSFEYLFFLKHLANGYRVDLCTFDWKKKFLPLRGSVGPTCKIAADHGWQPTQATLVEGQDYEYAATGSWKTSPTADAVNAGGDSSGRGRLVGAVMKDFELSKPFDLGVAGNFTAEQSGNLWVRCQDEWTELADNRGQISLKLKLKNP